LIYKLISNLRECSEFRRLVYELSRSRAASEFVRVCPRLQKAFELCETAHCNITNTKLPTTTRCPDTRDPQETNYEEAEMTTQPMPADSRPEHIDNILSGLDRYNPETVSTFQDYVQYQCEHRTYDALANLALLKL